MQDIGFLCRQLQTDSRVVLIDMDTSLQFHQSHGKGLPGVYTREIFSKFGMPFDHIYAYKMTQTDPETVVESIPEHLRAAYHWINVEVNPDKDYVKNPFNLIHKYFNRNDIAIVKLDIDNDKIEQEFVQQLLQDQRFHETSVDTSSRALIDHYYFEHHLEWTKEHNESLSFLQNYNQMEFQHIIGFKNNHLVS